MAKVSLKLVVDTKTNRVVFAESGKDFVDILLSFLTLPMGTIVRLLGKNSRVGCMDKLYESVEKLDDQYLQTSACKKMLLEPRGASESQCENLAINVDNLEPRRLYRCSNWECLTKTHCLFSDVPGVRCRCGLVMAHGMSWIKEKLGAGSNVDGVFVKGEARFIISDDLHVTPIKIGSTLSMLQRLVGVKDADALEKRTVDGISKNQILLLLKRTLLSKTPLTDVFVTNQHLVNSDGMTEKLNLIDTSQVKSESDDLIGTSQVESEGDATNRSKMIRVRLVESKSTNKVVWAEAGEDLGNLLFSFLTFPLGSIVKLLNKHSSLGCADHLYKSVEAMVAGDGDHIKSEECKNMLLFPKLASHFGCSNQPLKIDEVQITTSNTHCCRTWFADNDDTCAHCLKAVTITKINPKLPIPGTEHGGGFTKQSAKFMVTDRMFVTQLSPSSGIDLAKEQQVPITSLDERDVTLGEKEVLNLLKACLISRAGVSHFFSPKKGKRMPLP